jgi:hypothetical protein
MWTADRAMLGATLTPTTRQVLRRRRYCSARLETAARAIDAPTDALDD